jgi:hypothetical protein
MGIKMSWESYNIDQVAHDLVLEISQRKDVLKEVYKMRVTVTYGLERFWGETLCLQGEKAAYWQQTWQTLVQIMAKANVQIPNDSISLNDPKSIKLMTDKLWNFDIQQRKVALVVLTQLCESMIWWTERYK